MSSTSHDHAESFTEMPWVKFLGIEMTRCDPGVVTLQIDPKPEHLNQNGTVNAPVMFGLAEAAGAAVIVMGFLERLGMTYSVVRHVEMDFLAAGRGPISATGRISPDEVDRVRDQVAAGQSVDVEIPVTVEDQTDRTIARISMVLAVRPPRTT